MKKFLFVALSLLALPSVASAAINVVGGVNTQDFSTAPVASDWSSGSIAGAGNTASDTTALDNVVLPTAASFYSGTLATSATNPPTTAIANWRYNTTNLNVQSDPTGNAANGLLATLHDNTSNYISALGVTFDVILANFTPVEQIPGVRAYWSATGAANSWTAAGSFDVGANQSFNISGLAHNFGNNPFYLLFVDDNADGGTEGYYALDNVRLNATLGDPLIIVPPTPDFGTIVPPATNTVTGGNLTTATSTGGVVLNEAGNDVLHENNSGLSVITNRVDLRGVPAASTKFAAIDVKTFEDSATSDFETGDNIHAVVHWSADGLDFNSTIDLVPMLIGGAAIADPADQLKALDTGAYTHFQVNLPAAAKSAYIDVSAVNNSASEHFYFDNLAISSVGVPEPATVAMFTMGMIGLVGYGVRRRRSA